MKDLYTDLEQWFSETPLVIQESARLLIETETLESSQLDYLCELSKKEAAKERPSISGVTKDQLSFGDTGHTIRLKSISNIKGVNNLAPRSPLPFKADNLSVIFGGNGAGKSGYTRILKHACGAKHLGKLLGNVFKAEAEPIECKLHYEVDGNEKSITWTPSTGIVKELSSVEIFDSTCGDVYATRENETVYEPFILRLFSRISEACAAISEKLSQEITLKPSQKPKIPKELESTPSGLWYNAISPITTNQEKSSSCSWTEKDAADLVSITDRLLAANPLEQAVLIRRSKNNAEDLKQRILTITTHLSDSAIADILTQEASALEKRSLAESYAKSVFEGAPLLGVGEKAWTSLWEAARSYSTKFAYKDQEFPYLEGDSKCVLCQQPLIEDAKRRLSSFEAFIQSRLEADAKALETAYSSAINSIPSIPTPSEALNQIDAAGIIDESLRTQLLLLFSALTARKEWLNITPSERAEITPTGDSCLPNLDALAAGFEDRASKLEADAKESNRDLLLSQQLNLKAKKWVSEQVGAIDVEMARLAEIELLKNAQKLTATTKLSVKKSALADIILSAEYLQRFRAELDLLGAKRIQVEIIKTRADKGKILHQIKITGIQKPGNIEEVLSQGEYRVVSLAAFLADSMGRIGNSTFIFDDPISSLDQEFEERLVDRLVELSKTRQVIVFTHRLSLLFMLVDSTKKAGNTSDERFIRSEPWGKGEPGDLPYFAKNPSGALKAIRTERLAQAKRILTEKGKSEYDFLAKGICSDFRILIEGIIETELLSQVVMRFRRAVVTKDKIHLLAKINPDDCRLLEDMMTKYSKFEHSQPQESPVDLPLPDEIDVDMATISAWVQEFRARP